MLRRGHSLESGKQAEEILRNQRADVIATGRPLLVNPFWSVNASKSLKV
ncbi:NADPH dehydrogenase [Bacillus pseudomycoides]|nr:NADPH dehydrogenase [Bacillus pseudomycoides]